MFTTLAIPSTTLTTWLVIKCLNTDLCIVFEGYNLLYLPFSELILHCNVKAATLFQAHPYIEIAAALLVTK